MNLIYKSNTPSYIKEIYKSKKTPENIEISLTSIYDYLSINNIKNYKNNFSYVLNRLLHQDPLFVELLWIDPKYIILTTPIWERLRYNRINLLSKQLINNYISSIVANTIDLIYFDSIIRKKNPGNRIKEPSHIEFCKFYDIKTGNLIDFDIKNLNKFGKKRISKEKGLWFIISDGIGLFDSKGNLNKTESNLNHKSNNIAIMHFDKDKFTENYAKWRKYLVKFRNSSEHIIQYGYDTAFASEIAIDSIIAFLIASEGILHLELPTVYNKIITRIYEGHIKYDKTIEFIEQNVSYLTEQLKNVALPDIIKKDFLQNLHYESYNL